MSVFTGCEFNESNREFHGTYCTFHGYNLKIYGDYNNIYGNNCVVYGNYNKFYGNKNVVDGSYNRNYRGTNYFRSGSYNTGFSLYTSSCTVEPSIPSSPVIIQKYVYQNPPVTDSANIYANNLYVNSVDARQATVQQPARSASLLASPEPKRAKEPKDMTTDDKLEELLSNDITKGKIQNLQNLHKEKLNEYQLELDDALDSSIKFLYNKYVTEEKERQKIEAENLMKAAKEAEEKKKLEEERRKNKDKESEMEIMLKFLAEKMNKDKEVVIV